jgi:CelD/BcsL family acetyltransferase involved in cellulose biosynthesis
VETNRHNILAVPWIRDSLRAFYHSKTPDFRGEIACLYFGDHLAALEFGLRAGNAMHSWFPAFDRAYAQVSPGILLMDAMIENCAKRGIEKVDLGIGHAQYKRHASNAPTIVYGGTLALDPWRRAAKKTVQALTTFTERKLSKEAASFFRRIQRRQEMILASEPSFAGRLKGYVSAVRAVGVPQS